MAEQPFPHGMPAPLQVKLQALALERQHDCPPEKRPTIRASLAAGLTVVIALSPGAAVPLVTKFLAPCAANESLRFCSSNFLLPPYFSAMRYASKKSLEEQI